MTEEKLKGMEYLVANVSDEYRQIITSAINTYGDGDHPVATEQTLSYFTLPYVAYCLGRQYHAVVGMSVFGKTDPDENHLKLHEAHQEILDVIIDALEFGV